MNAICPVVYAFYCNVFLLLFSTLLMSCGLRDVLDVELDYLLFFFGIVRTCQAIYFLRAMIRIEEAKTLNEIREELAVEVSRDSRGLHSSDRPVFLRQRRWTGHPNFVRYLTLTVVAVALLVFVKLMVL